MAPVLRFLVAFALTVVVELGVAVPLLAPGPGSGSEPLAESSLLRRIATVCVAQMATHPAVWFFWPLFGWPRPVYLLVAESFALVTELLIYRLVFQRLSWARVLSASALANGASVVLGAWLR
jgi:hypothetical protein